MNKVMYMNKLVNVMTADFNIEYESAVLIVNLSKIKKISSDSSELLELCDRPINDVIIELLDDYERMYGKE